MVDLNSLPLPQLFEQLNADGSVARAIGSAIKEDLQSPGDITTRSIIDREQQAHASLVARQPGIVAGLPLLSKIIGDGSIKIELLMNDGQSCESDQTIARLRGSLSRMLGLERIMLNFISRLAGVASLTRQYVDAVAGTNVKICDTRKTTPGLRSLEKYAVRCGGGTLHRSGLFDAALYKDNHLAAIAISELASRLQEAIKVVRAKHYLRFVEVEVDSIEQFQAILAVEPKLIDIVLLDNMNVKDLARAVKMRDEQQSKLLLEASGGVNLKTVRKLADAGVDRISVGALTHSASSLDMGLDISQ